jgi:serine protease
VRAAAARLSRCAATLAVLATAGLAAASQATATPFVPDDAGLLGDPGGWRQEQWNFDGRYGVGAPRAWANLIAAHRPGGHGVTVAVLDSGVAYTNRPPFHSSPDLAYTWFVPGYDFVDDDPYPLDQNGHGTHVASTIGEQTDNGVGLTGLAYGVRLMPVRVLDRDLQGDAGVIARGVRFAAAHGAKIINLSLSFDARIGPEQVPQLQAAIDEAHARGSLVVASTGNEAKHVLAYPARAEGALAVSATTEHGCLASYADSGPGLDVVAPGGGNDGAVPGDPRCRAGRNGPAIEQVTLDRAHPDRFGIEGYIGTSMAAPHVSAAAALVVASGVIGADPPPAEIADRLEQTARDLGPPGYDESYGWGLVDAAAATTPGAAQRAPASARREPGPEVASDPCHPSLHPCVPSPSHSPAATSSATGRAQIWSCRRFPAN